MRAGLCLLLCALACTGEEQSQAPDVSVVSERPPDVLLIVMDTVRSDRLHTYGHVRKTSMQLDAIATAGVRFADVTADGTWTWPGHASLFTGEPPWVHGAHWSTDPDKAGRVDPKTGYWEVAPLRTDLPTLAERFAAAGYRTVALSSNSLLAPELGLTRGYERAQWLQQDRAVVQAAAGVMGDADSRPLFLTINLMAAHAPYSLAPEVPWSGAHTALFQPGQTPQWMVPYRLDRDPPALGLTERPSPEALNGEEAYAKGELKLQASDLKLIEDLYDGELIRIDKALSALVGDWNRTGHGQGIVAVTSDHGEYLGEHGQIGHGFSVFNEVTQVPLVIAAPGRLPAGTVVQTPVQLSDVYDTLLDLSGVATDGEHSLVRVIKGQPRVGPIQSAAWPMAVWSTRVGGRFALGHRLYREGDDVLIMDSAGGTALFHADDRPMLNDRSQAEPDRVAALRASAAHAFPEVKSGDRVRVPNEALRQLQALGYTE